MSFGRRETVGFLSSGASVRGEGWRHVKSHPPKEPPTKPPIPQLEMEIPDSTQQGLITKIVDVITSGRGHWKPTYNWDEVIATSLRIPHLNREEKLVHQYLDSLRNGVNALEDRATVDFAPFNQVVLAIHGQGPPGLFFPKVGLYVPFLIPAIGGFNVAEGIEKLFTQRLISLSHLSTATQRQVDTALRENVKFLNGHFNLGLNWVPLESDHDYKLEFDKNRFALTVVHPSEVQPILGVAAN